MSSVSARPSYQHAFPLTAERGRLQPAAAVSNAPSYSQKHLLSKARAASSSARRVLPSGGGVNSNVLNDYSATLRRTLSAGRRRGSSSCKTRKSVVGGVFGSPDLKRVTFMNDNGRVSENSLYVVPPASTRDDRCNNNSSNKSNSISIGNSEDGNPVQHLLLELVDISQTLATYLQNGGGDFVLQQKRAQFENVNRAVFPQQHGQQQQQEQRQQATLKAQEIERIVRRVENHFAQKIASMQQKEKEQTKKIAELTAELCRLQQEKQQATDNSRNLSILQGSPTFSVDGLSGGEGASRFQQNQEFTAKGNCVVATTNNNASDSNSEANNLRRMLQEEKRQRLFVEEQTQSLTEQHSRVVSTLERRLQKQEEQLRELAASLEHKASAPAESSASQSSSSATRLPCAVNISSASTPLVSDASCRRQGGAAPRSAQPQTAGPLISHADFTHRTNLSAGNNAEGGNYGQFIVPGFTKQGSRLTNEYDTRRAGKEVPSVFLSEPPLQSSSVANYQQLRGKENWQNSCNRGTNLVDIASAKAVEEVDEITVFLDNITQELESIDAMEGEREKQLSVAVARRMS